jgi:hypothetical protein
LLKQKARREASMAGMMLARETKEKIELMRLREQIPS